MYFQFLLGLIQVEYPPAKLAKQLFQFLLGLIVEEDEAEGI
ncbi:hypothetical protein J5U22_01659 [Saccharolobus shibatae]|uniref:Uncharacterized protein n=1 Tax=Saccharolobus shibatae TaxID=2286 RepID=A0A8F5C129_9CREN|nr:hypothetical protein J5U22_01659 [Saccharolobus shibatae]